MLKLPVGRCTASPFVGLKRENACSQSRVTEYFDSINVFLRTPADVKAVTMFTHLFSRRNLLPDYRSLRSVFSCFLHGLAVSETVKAQCDPGEQNWIVARESDTYSISKALENCTGGFFRVDWNGHVTLENTINILAQTSLEITGVNGLNAAVDGGGTTQLFHLDDAVLTLTNITLINGHGDRGGAIHAQDGSEVHFHGMLVLTNNHAAEGGAIWVENSKMSWDGHTTFANNMVYGIPFRDPNGGALSCSGSNMNFSGTTMFQNNSAGEAGGAVWVGSASTTYWHGNTNFVDNRSKIYGGGLMATDSTRIEFHGTTVATGNFAAIGGGAFRLAEESLIPTSLVFSGSTTISDNSAGDVGGRIDVRDHCDISWNGNMTLSGNMAAEDGGALSVIGDAITLNTRGTNLFRGNSANGYGGAVYSFGNTIGQSYKGVVFYSNVTARGGAIATFSSEQESENTYTTCIFTNNVASATGGAVEASVGKEEFVNPSFVDNSAGGLGGLKCPPGGGCAHYSKRNVFICV